MSKNRLSWSIYASLAKCISPNFPDDESNGKLVKDNLIKFIGVSNFNLKELQQAEQTLEDERIACNQVLYHLSYSAIEKRIVPYCKSKDIAVVGYPPFGHDELPSPNSTPGKALAKIGNTHGRTDRQVALNFLSLHSNIFTIPNPSLQLILFYF